MLPEKSARAHPLRGTFQRRTQMAISIVAGLHVLPVTIFLELLGHVANCCLDAFEQRHSKQTLRGTAGASFV